MPMSINRNSPPVSEVLTRAASDVGFRELLLRNPAAALAGYDLSDDDRAALSDWQTISSVAADDDWEARK